MAFLLFFLEGDFRMKGIVTSLLYQHVSPIVVEILRPKGDEVPSHTARWELELLF